MFSTHVGGSGAEHFDPPSGGVAVDAFSNIYVTGSTTSTDFPTSSPLQSAFGGFADAFVARISAADSPPAANAGPDQIVECSSSNGALVTLNGTLSSDSDGDSLTFAWTSPSFLGTLTGATPAVQLALGPHTITLVANDGTVNSIPDTVLITVEDTTSPNITAPADIGVIANTAGGYAGAIGTATASDTCDPSPTITKDGPVVIPPGDTTVTWTATDASGNSASATQTVTVKLTVDIDIKPGSFPNSINLGSGGNVRVAIFSTASFDATTVDPVTVTLAGATVKLKGKGTPMASTQDVNGDGLLDLVVHVTTEALELSETDTEAVLEGQTFGGIPITGVDTVRVVP